MKILIVDDEQDIELLFRQRFRKEVRAGLVELRFAFSGEEALASLREHDLADVVLVLSDINMPGMTGLELLKDLKSEFSGIRVHMITAYGDEDNYRQAMEYGADGYLTKPLDFNQLRSEVLQL